MKKFKGTKGPWCVSHPKGEHRRFIMANGERIATVAHNRGRTPAKINAPLIASAPELLDELQSARNTIQLLIGEGFIGYIEQRNRIDAAINKALGGGE